MGTGRGGSDLGGNDGVGAHGRAPLHGEHAATATGGVEHLAVGGLDEAHDGADQGRRGESALTRRSGGE